MTTEDSRQKVAGTLDKLVSAGAYGSPLYKKTVAYYGTLEALLEEERYAGKPRGAEWDSLSDVAKRMKEVLETPTPKNRDLRAKKHELSRTALDMRVHHAKEERKFNDSVQALNVLDGVLRTVGTIVSMIPAR